jgi:hypothetical protein
MNCLMCANLWRRLPISIFVFILQHAFNSQQYNTIYNYFRTIKKEQIIIIHIFNQIIMKQFLHAVFTLCCLLLISNSLIAQDFCESIATLKKGTELEYTTYNSKDKPDGKQSIKIVDVKKVVGKVISEVEATLYDKKGKETGTYNYNFECENNTYIVDLRNMLDPQIYAGFSNMEIEWSGTPSQYTNNLKVGDKIPDASMQMKARSGNVNILNMTIDVTDQQVEAKESLNTPAGSFNALKITSTTQVKAVLKRTIKSAIWFDAKVGTIRSENYDAKGKLTSYTLLTGFKAG